MSNQLLRIASLNISSLILLLFLDTINLAISYNPSRKSCGRLDNEFMLENIFIELIQGKRKVEEGKVRGWKIETGRIKMEKKSNIQ